MRGFGSDNHSGVHPDILKSFAEANIGHAPSYGTDEWTAKAEKVFQNHFGVDTQVFFVFNGTAANVTALKAMMSSYQAVLCSDISHMNMDECGAPEFFTGGKLIAVPSVDAKISVAILEQYFSRRGDQHASQARVLSLTQPTELGTTYTTQELRELIAWAKSKELLVHIDGARLANAAYHLKLGFKEFTTDLGIDVVSMGGTKNGLMMGEAVLFLNKSLAKDFKFIRKQAAQLPSKTRFISAQFLAYFQDDLWRKIAAHSSAMAQLMYQHVKDIPGIEVRCAPESNAVFAKIPKAWLKPLRQHFFFYVWDEKTFECRWMTSWDTQEQDILDFAKKLKELSR